MWQLIFGSQAAFADLERRARRACVRFRDQELPPGASPRRAAIGFEIDPTNGSAKLLVDYGVMYTGPSEDVRNWLVTGERRFESFEQLKRWIGTTLRQAFSSGALHLDADTCDNPFTELDEVEKKAMRIAIDLANEIDDLPS
jgi:hypothetical protein